MTQANDPRGERDTNNDKQSEQTRSQHQSGQKINESDQSRQQNQQINESDQKKNDQQKRDAENKSAPRS